MDTRFVDEFGRTLWIMGGKVCSFSDVHRACQEAGIPTREYSELATKRITCDEMDRRLSELSLVDRRTEWMERG